MPLHRPKPIKLVPEILKALVPKLAMHEFERHKSETQAIEMLENQTMNKTVGRAKGK